MTPCEPDIPCQVPWVYRSEPVFGIEPYPSHLRSVSVSTLTGLSINLPWDFHPVGKVCRLRGFCGFSRGMLFLRFCAWRISSNRYKITHMEWLASASHSRPRRSALNPRGPPETGERAKSGQTTRNRVRISVGFPFASIPEVGAAWDTPLGKA